MKKYIFLYLLFSIYSLSAFAGYEERLANHLGKSKSELIEIYGYPENSSMILEVDGKIIFNYKTQRKNERCLLSLEFKDGIFNGYWYDGKNCRKPEWIHHGSFKESKEGATTD